MNWNLATRDSKENVLKYLSQKKEELKACQQASRAISLLQEEVSQIITASALPQGAQANQHGVKEIEYDGLPLNQPKQISVEGSGNDDLETRYCSIQVVCA